MTTDKATGGVFMRFQSGKEKWVGVLLWGASLVCYVLAVTIFFTNLNLIVQILLAVVFAVFGIITHSAVIGTVYIIDRGNLRIKSGILIRKTIPLSRIVKVRPVVSWEASAALSHKRLRIYDHTGYWDVSPERADEFIRQLKEAAPYIHLDSDIRS